MKNISYFKQHSWPRYILKAAGIYNILWGTLVILMPNLFFELFGMALPSYPSIWQCVGMIVGVYGIGYWIAGNNPTQHWVIILVGFLGKIFGPIGFIGQLISGTYPLKFASLIVTNDLIWWVPFSVILFTVYKESTHDS